MAERAPGPAILSVGTALPPHVLEQPRFGRWLADAFPERPGLRRWMARVVEASGIERRYTVLPDFLEPAAQSRYSPARHPDDAPTTAARMAVYQRASVPLAAAAARAALADLASADGSGSGPRDTADSPHAGPPDQAASRDDGAGPREPAAAPDGVRSPDRAPENGPRPAAQSVTHLVVVTCTGFFAPGLDQAVARALGLPATVERTLVGFMGCAAAFNGLRLACDIVRGSPEARVLVVCVELCSLHIQPGDERENLISATLFGDGASAAVVGTPAPGRRADVLELLGFHTALEPDTQGEMVWQIGDHGFRLALSPRIPEHLARAAPAAMSTLLGDAGRPRFWAVHPGGRAIVDQLADVFGLDQGDVAASRSVLRRVGNLSSATILFVLDALRAEARDAGRGLHDGVAMAFGPGLVIEMAHLRYHPPRPSATARDLRAATTDVAAP